MKNVMLPTDFTVQSLWPVHNIVKEAGKEKVCIELVHVLSMPTDITDLFMVKRNKPYNEIPMHFKEAYTLLCNKYNTVIEKMVIRFIYGNTSRVLNNHIASSNIAEVYVLANHQYGLPFKNSMSFTELMADCCSVPVRSLELHNDAFLRYQILSSLLDKPEGPQEAVSERLVKNMMSFS